MSLEELIKARIREQGAITVAQYMETALSHDEYGYYMQRDPLGVAGDFITAPEISQVFGEIIGAWLVHHWQLLGAPSGVALVEPGAGRGTLMADILRATQNIKGFHEAVSVHLVEISPLLKQKQWKTLAGKHPRIEWHDSIDTIPQLPLLLVANEFFDALPIRQFIASTASPLGEWSERGQDKGWHERMVGIVDDKLAFITSAHDCYPAPHYKNGVAGSRCEFTETCEAALAIIKQLSQHIAINGGAALIIDYGYTEGSNGDTLQAMKNHSYHPVLEDAGSADITAHVDFSALAETARAENVNVHGAIPQGAFLTRLGAGTRTTALCKISTGEQQKSLVSGLKRLADPEEMGELFKVLAITSKHITDAEGF